MIKAEPLSHLVSYGRTPSTFSKRVTIMPLLRISNSMGYYNAAASNFKVVLSVNWWYPAPTWRVFIVSRRRSATWKLLDWEGDL